MRARRLAHRRPIGAVLALAGAAVVLGAVFSGIGAVLGHGTPAGEVRLMRHVDGGPSAVLTRASRVLSVLGSESVLVPVCLVVCVALVARARVKAAWFLAVTAAGAIGLSDAVKAIVARPRPPVRHLVHVASWSFPSGHATQNAAILIALALVAVAAVGARVGLVMTVALVLAAAIGVSRVLLGVHYPSDVVAGWLLGGAWVAVTYAVLPPGARTRSTPSTPGGEHRKRPHRPRR